MNTSTKIYLVDSPDSHANLLPLSFTRPVADFRVGITTIRESILYQATTITIP